MFRESCPLLLGHNLSEGVLVCVVLSLTPDRVPLSLSETGGPTIGFRRSEQILVEPVVAFKRDAKIASSYS